MKTVKNQRLVVIRFYRLKEQKHIYNFFDKIWCSHQISQSLLSWKNTDLLFKSKKYT